VEEEVHGIIIIIEEGYHHFKQHPASISLQLLFLSRELEQPELIIIHPHHYRLTI
jgi:hypothetical protein